MDTTISTNPLDSVEEVLLANDWVFDREGDDALSVQVSGRFCSYDVRFHWQEDFGALHMVSEFDLLVPEGCLGRAAQALMTMNGRSWIGHFDLPVETRRPRFRYTSLLRGMSFGDGASEHVRELIELALAECERCAPVFHVLDADTTTETSSRMALALVEPVGEA